MAEAGEDSPAAEAGVAAEVSVALVAEDLAAAEQEGPGRVFSRLPAVISGSRQ